MYNVCMQVRVYAYKICRNANQNKNNYCYFFSLALPMAYIRCINLYIHACILQNDKYLSTIEICTNLLQYAQAIIEFIDFLEMIIKTMTLSFQQISTQKQHSCRNVPFHSYFSCIFIFCFNIVRILFMFIVYSIKWRSNHKQTIYFLKTQYS